MSTEEIIEKFGIKLCETLPMEDPIFLQMLENNKILPGDSKDKIQARNEKAEKADYYIQCVLKIQPSSDLSKLLQAMEQYHTKYNNTALQDLLIHMLAEINGMFCKLARYAAS